MATKTSSFLGHGKRVTLATQLFNLKTMFPKSIGKVSKGMLRWSYDSFQSLSVSGVYRIEIEGKSQLKPSVWLSGGAIDSQTIVSAPHRYAIDEDGLRIKVCLDMFDWRPCQLYSSTYIPWTMEWIAHFEIWCVTGEWTGGGIHSGAGGVLNDGGA